MPLRAGAARSRSASVLGRSSGTPLVAPPCSIGKPGLLSLPAARLPGLNRVPFPCKLGTEAGRQPAWWPRFSHVFQGLKMQRPLRFPGRELPVCARAVRVRSVLRCSEWRGW